MYSPQTLVHRLIEVTVALIVKDVLTTVHHLIDVNVAAVSVNGTRLQTVDCRCVVFVA